MASSRFELLASRSWFVKLFRLEEHIHAQRTIGSKTALATLPPCKTVTVAAR